MREMDNILDNGLGRLYAAFIVTVILNMFPFGHLICKIV